MDDESISKALLDELDSILATPLGKWTKIAAGYESVWGEYSKSEFESIGPTYSVPRRSERSKSLGSRAAAVTR